MHRHIRRTHLPVGLAVAVAATPAAVAAAPHHDAPAAAASDIAAPAPAAPAPSDAPVLRYEHSMPFERRRPQTISASISSAATVSVTVPIARSLRPSPGATVPSAREWPTSPPHRCTSSSRRSGPSSPGSVITFDPDELERRLAELEEEMSRPGFWDDQEQAQKRSTEHARVSRRLASYRQLQEIGAQLAWVRDYL